MSRPTYVFTHGVEINFHQESQQVSTMHGTRKPDKGWTHFDSEGHAHAWRNGDELPTLYEKVTGKEWVGDSYDGCEVEITEWRCNVCDEVVEPKYVTDYSPVYVTGPPEYTLKLRANIMDQEWRIPEDDVAPLIDILRRIFV